MNLDKTIITKCPTCEEKASLKEEDLVSRQINKQNIDAFEITKIILIYDCPECDEEIEITKETKTKNKIILKENLKKIKVRGEDYNGLGKIFASIIGSIVGIVILGFFLLVLAIFLSPLLAIVFFILGLKK